MSVVEFDGQDIQEYIRSKLPFKLMDPWNKTIMEDYCFLNPTQQGHIGQLYISQHMRKEFGSIVLPPTTEDIKKYGATHTPYDSIIDGWKAEDKFSAAQSEIFYTESDPIGLSISTELRIKRNKKGEVELMINHVSQFKGWERLIFCGVDVVGGIIIPTFAWCTKEDFISCINETDLFSRQQGGKVGNNDDWSIHGGTKVRKWIESEYSRDIKDWNKDCKPLIPLSERPNVAPLNGVLEFANAA